MSTDDEELLNLLLRTTTLVRREQHHPGAPAPDGRPMPPGGPHAPHPDGPRGPQGPGGPDGMGGPGGPYPDPREANARHHGHEGRLAQGRVLAMLLVGEGQSQKELAYLLGIRPQSLTTTLAHLEEDGCIERRKNPDDGRVVNVFLTDAGRERAQQAVKRRKVRAEGAFAVLDESEKDELARILEKLSEALED